MVIMERADYEDLSSFFLQELPEDVLAHLSASLSPKDLCNLSLTCKKLHNICMSDKLWWHLCKIARQIENPKPMAETHHHIRRRTLQQKPNHKDTLCFSPFHHQERTHDHHDEGFAPTPAPVPAESRCHR